MPSPRAPPGNFGGHLTPGSPRPSPGAPRDREPGGCLWGSGDAREAASPSMQRKRRWLGLGGGGQRGWRLPPRRAVCSGLARARGAFGVRARTCSIPGAGDSAACLGGIWGCRTEPPALRACVQAAPKMGRGASLHCLGQVTWVPPGPWGLQGRPLSPIQQVGVLGGSAFFVSWSEHNKRPVPYFGHSL